MRPADASPHLTWLMMSDPNRLVTHARPAFWRDVRVLRVVAQLAFIVVVVIVAQAALANLQAGLARLRITFGFDFLQQTAGFGIGEGPPYSPTDSYATAFAVGVVNTLRVILVAIPAATLLGVLAGIARLSRNWLLSRIATVYVETFRNIPLLLQLFVWYTAVILKLPTIDTPIVWIGPTYLSNRGIYLPSSTASPALDGWLSAIGVGLILAIVVYVLRRRYQENTGRSGYAITLGVLVFVVFALGGWLLSPVRPLIPDIPVREGFNFKGGMSLTPEYAGLLIGLVMYTGAFIAEVVRAGIQAVSKGQTEAARALGLSNSQVLRLVVLPQALRVIIPPLTNQYLNLAKNSSLGVAIGYPELFSVGGTI